MKPQVEQEPNRCPECGSEQLQDHYFYVECLECGATQEPKDVEVESDEDFAERLQATAPKVRDAL